MKYRSEVSSYKYSESNNLSFSQIKHSQNSYFSNKISVFCVYLLIHLQAVKIVLTIYEGQYANADALAYALLIS
jgi:hypothetical protein